VVAEYTVNGTTMPGVAGATLTRSSLLVGGPQNFRILHNGRNTAESGPIRRRHE
jgi:hypothetical protein